MLRNVIKRAFSTIAIIYNESKELTGFIQFCILWYNATKALSCPYLKYGRFDILVNTMNCISKSNIVFNIQDKLGINNIKRTRLSVGDTHHDSEIRKDDFEWEINPLYLIERLTEMSIFRNYQELYDLIQIKLISFFHMVSEGSLRFTRENKHFYQGRRILSREITNS